MTERIQKKRYIAYDLGKYGPRVHIEHGQARLDNIASTGVVLTRKELERMLHAIDQMESSHD